SSRGIVFGEPSSPVAGSIIYNGTSNADGLDFRTNGNLVRMAINDVGNIGIGTVGSSIDAVLHVESDSARVIKVDRHGSDGELLSWARDDASIGSVTVTSGVVAYGAFTGVHYARLDESITVGTLVSLNGDNDTLGERDDGEVVYGVIASARANDPAVLGVYIGSLHGEGYGHSRDIAQIAALGNGDMWVIDTGEPISPGDNLIASGTPGCGMKDDVAKYAVGNVIARAAARVDWTNIAPDASGRKRARISVLFSNFVRATPTNGSHRNDVSNEQDIEIAGLRQELDELRAAFARFQESLQR
ncbi:MAG TPA: hypothetical protein VFX76_22320, partial [Roseiflexaceae bacterium]|nr:hypothetical protein [Roseiflexaceae bacterium]